MADAGVGTPIEPDDAIIGLRARERGRPSVGDALGVTGGIAVAVGVLLITLDIYLHHPGRGAGIALFAGLVVVGVVLLGLAPTHWHAAAVTMVVIGVFGAMGWWWLPHAHSFSDVRPFLLLTIGVYALCFIAPRVRGRAIFIALILVLTWLWVLGEVVGNDGFSYAPIPSPPPHTMFSLAALHNQTDVSIDDLDSTDPLYPLAQRCDDGEMSACDQLFGEASAGSDFKQFASECGQNGAPSDGDCVTVNDSGSSGDIVPNPTPISPIFPNPRNPQVDHSYNDKSTEIGIVSLLFGLAYLFGLFALGRRRFAGLATAFVLPAALALFSGTQTLGNAVHHAWFGGLLTLFAGLLFGIVGDIQGRRFTAWLGGVAVAVGALTIALDFANLRRSANSGHRLLKPGFITLATGAALIVIAALITIWLTARSQPKPEPPAGDDVWSAPTPAPVAPAAAPATAPAAPPPPTPPPVAPPPAAPPPSWGAPPSPTPPPSPPTWPPPPQQT